MSFILNILSLTHKNEPAVVAPHAPENETKAAEVVETPTVKEAPKEEKSKKATKNKKK